MSFTDTLRAWITQLPLVRAEPAELAEPLGSDDCACSGGCARSKEDARWLGVPLDVQAWGGDAAEHYLERMAIASDLGMDTDLGSDAERVARREALRLSCGWPIDRWPPSRAATRSDDLLAKATDLFGPKGPDEALPCIPSARFGE